VGVAIGLVVGCVIGYIVGKYIRYEDVIKLFEK
jgi:membrane protein DedA with SNARE-associated domain